MPLALADRLVTIAATATVTSAAWIAAGGTLFRAETPEVAAVAEPAEAAVRPREQAPAAMSGEALIIPVAGVQAGQLTDTFSDARGEGRPHDAIDIMAPAGTPVVAAAGGTIEKLFVSRDGGNTIYVRSPDRSTLHYYAHMQGYAAGLAEGQTMRQGQALGTVGSSGNADPAAPHLHFAVLRTTPQAEWWDPAVAVNPYPLLSGRR